MSNVPYTAGKGNVAELTKKKSPSEWLEKPLKSESFLRTLFTSKSRGGAFSGNGKSQGANGVFQRKQLDFELNAPFSLEQVKELAMYHYLKWRLSKEPESSEMQMHLKSYSPQYADVMLTLVRDKGLNGKKARAFMLDAKKEALRAAAKIVHEKKALLSKLEEIGQQREEELAQVEAAHKSALVASKKFYVRKGEFLATWIEKKLAPVEVFLKKVVVPIGAVLVAGSAWIKEALQSVPFLSQMQPEAIGIAMVGLWLVARVIKTPLDWHLGVVRNRLPKKEVRNAGQLVGEMNRQNEQAQEDYQYKKDWQVGNFEKQKQQILQELEGQYVKLLDRHGYWAFN